MITICPGWSEQGHKNVIVLKPEDGLAPGTSHGMCAECQQALDRQLSTKEAYDEYRRAFPNADPRD